MANKSTKKSKKPLQTTLGRAAAPSTGQKVDLSHVGKPIHTSIFSLSQLLSLTQTGTQEVVNYVDNECDIIFECRVCRTLFRSIANFILHKREYCREQFSIVSHYTGSFLQDSTVLQVSSENSNIKPNSKKVVGVTASADSTGNTLASVVRKLKEKCDIKEYTKMVLTEDLSEVKEDSSKILANNKSHDILMEQIGSNNVAVFQTLLKSDPGKDENLEENMKSQVMEIHTIMGKDEAVLGSDGKLFTLQATNKSATACKTELICPECKLKFATKKTLTYHVKYKHNKTRRVFVCPDCKGNFSNAWGVYRHLFKIHRRTAAYIKRMRDQINNSIISKEALPVKKTEKTDSDMIDATDEENQWLNNIEGDKDFQMCGGCGKRFERKAALHSHAQMCIKRIAVCNSIKENSAKRKEEENKDKSKLQKVDKVFSSEPSKVLKGASKRKPYLLRTYKKPGDILVKPEEKTSDICDVNDNSKIVEINCDISSNVVTDNSFIKNEVVCPKSTESKLTNVCLNTSDNLENFRGFSRDCEVELPRINSQHCEQSVITSDIFWGKLSALCSVPSTRTPTIEHRRFLRNNTGFTEINLSPVISCEDAKKDVLNRSLTDSEEFTEFNISSPKRSGKITLRSLEDLTGISPINNKRKPTLAQIEDTTVTQSHIDIMKEFELRYRISENENTSESVKANVSPKMLKKKVRPSKRQRSISYDTSPIKKTLDNLHNDSLPRDRDVNFVEKASPFMDRKNLRCKPCKKTYPTFAKLLWHMSGHFSWFRFQCSKCSFISFSKSDCEKHAKVTHSTDRNDLESVVLPIPNWKIALMSHDFSEFDEENDLTGKHTDEVIIDCDDEQDINEEEERKKLKCDNSDDEVTITGTLFVDTEGNEDFPSDMSCLPLPIVNDSFQIKREITDFDDKQRDEVIDIIEDTNDSFLIEEIPQEIYNADTYEVIPDAINDVENTQFSVLSHNTDDDLFNKYFIPRTKDIEIVIMDKIKEEASDSSEDSNITPHRFSTMEKDIVKKTDCETFVEVNGSEVRYNSNNDNCENLEEMNSPKKLHSPSHSVPFSNTRPTRNRTRSIKTRHDDFFYELNKSLKPNEVLNTKTNATQKVKKNPGSLSPKNKILPPKSAKIS